MKRKNNKINLTKFLLPIVMIVAVIAIASFYLVNPYGFFSGLSRGDVSNKFIPVAVVGEAPEQGEWWYWQDVIYGTEFQKLQQTDPVNVKGPLTETLINIEIAKWETYLKNTEVVGNKYIVVGFFPDKDKPTEKNAWRGFVIRVDPSSSLMNDPDFVKGLEFSENFYDQSMLKLE